jgi:hypothetical protein
MKLAVLVTPVSPTPLASKAGTYTMPLRMGPLVTKYKLKKVEAEAVSLDGPAGFAETLASTELLNVTVLPEIV